MIIATLDRVGSLERVLDCLDAQTRRPVEIIVSAAGDIARVKASIRSRSSVAPLRLLASPVKSAAIQRNHAAENAIGDVFAFMDDDIEFGASLLADVLGRFDGFDEQQLGALSPRIAEGEAPLPSRLIRLYYRLQAGYPHPHYGGKLFGPAINRFPVFDHDGPDLVHCDWLPSTCLFIRSELFRRHRFPRFDGYSFAEDVHLTARSSREAPSYFMRAPVIVHHSLPSEFKSDRVSLASGKLHNMAVVSREVIGLSGWRLWWRWQLHRLFLSAVLLARRPARWADELRGVWLARP